MTIRQLLNRIAQLAEIAAQCVIEGARTMAAEFYNLVFRLKSQKSPSKLLAYLR